jgi:hypothetical protein
MAIKAKRSLGSLQSLSETCVSPYTTKNVVANVVLFLIRLPRFICRQRVDRTKGLLVWHDY